MRNPNKYFRIKNKIYQKIFNYQQHLTLYVVAIIKIIQINAHRINIQRRNQKNLSIISFHCKIHRIKSGKIQK
jgi:hypothetical protein